MHDNAAPCAGLLKRLHPVTAPAAAAAKSGGANYGGHLAASLALGLLFLGGGARTLATDDASVAALVIALFPAFPASPLDQRHHLQARKKSCL
jgi:anaphase-promoting complex subunit 1